jgi:hypothetical protein
LEFSEATNFGKKSGLTSFSTDYNKKIENILRSNKMRRNTFLKYLENNGDFALGHKIIDPFFDSQVEDDIGLHKELFSNN